MKDLEQITLATENYVRVVAEHGGNVRPSVTYTVKVEDFEKTVNTLDIDPQIDYSVKTGRRECFVLRVGYDLYIKEER